MSTLEPNQRTYLDLSFCEGNGLDGFVAKVDASVDRHEPSDEPEVGDYENGLALSAAMSQGWRG